MCDHTHDLSIRWRDYIGSYGLPQLSWWQRPGRYAVTYGDQTAYVRRRRAQERTDAALRAACQRVVAEHGRQTTLHLERRAQADKRRKELAALVAELQPPKTEGEQGSEREERERIHAEALRMAVTPEKAREIEARWLWEAGLSPEPSATEGERLLVLPQPLRSWLALNPQQELEAIRGRRAELVALDDPITPQP